MKIIVREQNRKEFFLELDEDATVEDLLDKGKCLLKINKGLTMTYKGRMINTNNSNSTLISLGITDFSGIGAFPRITGGGAGFCEVKKLPSVKEFSEKLEEYKPENEDENISIRYYKAQSGHTSLSDKPVEVVYEIDEDLEDDWIQNIKKGLNSISTHAPGIKFTQYSDVKDKICPCGGNFYRIEFCKIDEEEAHTKGNIYNQKAGCISLGNSWTDLRFGTAMHRTLHAIGFKHNHCRPDQYENVVADSPDGQYEIEEDSKGKTAYKSTSVMFNNEDEYIMRVSNTGLFKLK